MNDTKKILFYDMIPDLNEPSLHLLGKSDTSKFKTTCTESFIYSTQNSEF